MAATSVAATDGSDVPGHGEQGRSLPRSRLESSVAAEIRCAASVCDAAVAIAVLGVGEGEVVYTLTYAELLGWAAEVAGKLLEFHSVAPCCQAGFRLVALVMERTPLVIAAVLGAWEAGAAVAPVPKDLPPGRVASLCEEATVILTDGCPALMGLPMVLVLSTEPPHVHQVSAATWPKPDAPCMVTYTSGSTGRPKGVVCNHRCLWHSVCCYSLDTEVSRDSRLLWKTPYQWRTAEYELYPALCVGGTLYIAPEGAHRELDYLARVVKKHAITAITTVPTVLAPLAALLVDADGTKAQLRHAAAVGEPLPSQVCGAFLGANVALLHNYYGLTESGMTTWTCSRLPGGPIAPVGWPQPHVTVSVIAAEGGSSTEPYANGAALAPRGAVIGTAEGEVHFGGIMASGYLNDAALTAQRFVQAAGGGTLCRTGDLGRFNSLGELEVLGRIDRQVKLHGIRIELGEIEAVLRKVCQDVVVVPCAEDDQTLVAFFVSTPPCNGAVAAHCQELRVWARQQLPLYMVPLHFIALDALPRLQNEKVDQAALRQRTWGLMTRAVANSKLEAGCSTGAEVAELVRYVDSLGFVRALNRKQAADRRLWDNLVVLGMLNVILFHWYWYVLVEPRSYLPPWQGYHFGDTVVLPHLPVAPWVVLTYRVMTQEWVNGVFVLAAIELQSPEELTRFTRRELAAFALYVYVGLLPMALSFLCPAQLDEYVFKAETIQRWFLLVLVLGKAVLVVSHRIGVPSGLQVAILLVLLVMMPGCWAELCGRGGEYLLPTDWWPTCTACALTPKEVVCLVLYVGAAHIRPFERLRALGPRTGLLLFVASCLLACAAPGQAAVEFSMGSGSPAGHLARLLGLAFTVLQTAGLVGAAAGLPEALHPHWAARWALGSYLFNVNFLDAIFLPPGARWSLLQKVQLGGPVLSGLLTWAAMLLPVAPFMLGVAPLLQELAVSWPLRLCQHLAAAGGAALRAHSRSRSRWRGSELGRPAFRQPLLE